MTAFTIEDRMIGYRTLSYGTKVLPLQAYMYINVSATIFKTAVAFGCSRQIMACGNSALVRSPSQMTEMNPGPSDCLLSIAYCVDPGTSR